MEFLLQHIHRGVFCLLRFCRNRAYGLGKRSLVHFMVLVQRNGINLHDDLGSHIRWFLFEYEGVQGLNVYRRIAHYVGSNELACSFSFCIESMNGGVLDTWEFTDDGFHFLQFDAETANLHHSVATTNEHQFTVIAAHNDVACLENPTVSVVFRYFLCCQLRSVQIATTYLRSHDP